MTTTPARRVTKQRVAIADQLERSEAFLSAQDLHAALSRSGERIGLATVYRTLSAMATDGELDVRRTDDGEALYRRCDTEGHHHHMVCRTCGRTVEIGGPKLEEWLAEVSGRFGYVDIDHTVEITGTCPECAAKA
ncbi:Fur family transcriptional regulator [Kribbia dieselivorans]|uniref:Fur family transcriptional regulator n=1 Tax=Kribbia dieselivorans TaxID=331526 RepID=UPI0008397789|nr:Fur family transcriptional regulator [Kribbia dieselivorans]